MSIHKNHFIMKKIDYLMRELVKITHQLENKAQNKLEQKRKKAA
ncbi:hypothetical protein ACWIW6_03420 [Ursidibacter sp. B-7004-1]